MSLSHQYANNRPDEDPYTIQLFLKDGEGGTDSALTTLVVTNAPPVLESWSLTSPRQEGQTAFLSGTMSDPGPDDLVLSLNWGEGMQEVHHYPAGTTTFSLSHTYLDDNPSGTPSDPYNVTMILVDEDLDLDTGSDVVIVQNVAPQAVTGPDQQVVLGSPVILNGSIVDQGILDTHVYWWDMGDGTIISDTLQINHTYTAAGQYTVTFHVVDDDTGTAASTVQVTVLQTDFPVLLPIIFSPSQ